MCTMGTGPDDLGCPSRPDTMRLKPSVPHSPPSSLEGGTDSRGWLCLSDQLSQVQEAIRDVHPGSACGLTLGSPPDRGLVGKDRRTSSPSDGKR